MQGTYQSKAHNECKLVAVTDQDESQILKEDQDIKYQDIVYYMSNGTKSVNNEPVDFPGAVNEMKDIGWRLESKHIGFDNRRTKDVLQFLRFGEDLWYADSPIRGGRGWKGYALGCRTDTEGAINVVRLFFEEAPWFGSLSWERYATKYANDYADGHTPRHLAEAASYTRRKG